MDINSYKNYTNKIFHKIMEYSGLKYEDIKKNPLITWYLCALAGIFNASAGTKCVV